MPMPVDGAFGACSAPGLVIWAGYRWGHSCRLRVRRLPAPPRSPPRAAEITKALRQCRPQKPPSTGRFQTLRKIPDPSFNYIRFGILYYIGRNNTCIDLKILEIQYDIVFRAAVSRNQGSISSRKRLIAGPRMLRIV